MSDNNANKWLIEGTDSVILVFPKQGGKKVRATITDATPTRFKAGGYSFLKTSGKLVGGGIGSVYCIQPLAEYVAETAVTTEAVTTETAAKPGSQWIIPGSDEVVVSKSWGRIIIREAVVRVTKTMIVTESGRYYINGGDQVGGNPSTPYMLAPTETAMVELKKSEDRIALKAKLEALTLKVDSLSADDVTALLAQLEA